MAKQNGAAMTLYIKHSARKALRKQAASTGLSPSQIVNALILSPDRPVIVVEKKIAGRRAAA